MVKSKVRDDGNRTSRASIAAVFVLSPQCASLVKQ
jgi:hypothetical protein